MSTKICSRCRFWVKATGPVERGLCTRFTQSEVDLPIDEVAKPPSSGPREHGGSYEEGRMVTGPFFGCVKFEERNAATPLWMPPQPQKPAVSETVEVLLAELLMIVFLSMTAEKLAVALADLQPDDAPQFLPPAIARLADQAEHAAQYAMSSDPSELQHRVEYLDQVHQELAGVIAELRVKLEGKVQVAFPGDASMGKLREMIDTAISELAKTA